MTGDGLAAAEAAYFAVLDDPRPEYTSGVADGLDLLREHFTSAGDDLEWLRREFAGRLTGRTDEHRQGAVDVTAAVAGILAAMRAERPERGAA